MLVLKINPIRLLPTITVYALDLYSIFLSIL